MKKLKLLLIIPLIFLMLTGCETEQDRINKQYHIEYDQAIKEFKDKNLPELKKSELQAIRDDIASKTFENAKGKDYNFKVLTLGIDEINGVVDVGLYVNNEETRKEFKEKVNDSEYVVFYQTDGAHLHNNNS